MRICKICGTNFLSLRKKGAAFCSSDCREIGMRKKKRCEPECDLESVYLREVEFKNSTTHKQMYCDRCLRTEYVSSMISSTGELRDILHSIREDEKKRSRQKMDNVVMISSLGLGG